MSSPYEVFCEFRMLSPGVENAGVKCPLLFVQKPDLDAEASAMIERAQPLPPFPDSMTQDQLDLTVPVRFSLEH